MYSIEPINSHYKYLFPQSSRWENNMVIGIWEMVGYSDNIFRPEEIKKESWCVIVANWLIKAVKLNNILAISSPITHHLICHHKSIVFFCYVQPLHACAPRLAWINACKDIIHFLWRPPYNIVTKVNLEDKLSVLKHLELLCAWREIFFLTAPFRHK